MSLEIVPAGHNLCTYFILPLLDLNKDSYKGFVNCFLSYNGKVIVKLDNKPESSYWLHPEYVTDYTLDGYTYIIYSIPPQHLQELNLFLEGRYSEYPAASKKIIYRNSGLEFNKNVGDQIITHNLLLVMAKHPNLRAHLEKELEVMLPKSGELWNKPDLDKEILDIDTDICFDK